MTPTITPQLAHNALRIVFGDDSPYAVDVHALAGLSQKELATRFRGRALELHPDRAGALGQPAERLERAFKRLHGAYRLLSRLLEDEHLCRRVLESARASSTGRRPARSAASGGLWTPQHEAPTKRGAAASAPHGRGRSAHNRTGATSGGTGAGVYYRGRVPESELRFAQFLYYNRVIDWKTMIDAITWQYRVRPKIGEIGRAYKFLDFEAVTQVLRTSPQGELFGSTAMKLGLLDRRQLYVVLGKQHQLNYPIGRYFLENDILSKPEIDHLLVQNRRHNLKHRRS
jgi:hypothetical protein